MAMREPLRARRVIGMRPLAGIYRRRLRVQWVQELFAGAGIAVAVALVFATLVASQSIASSAAAVMHEIAGPATLQLKARGPEGFSEAMLGAVERLPGVKASAPVLESTARLHGPHGRQATVQLVGGDVALTTLDGLAHSLPGSTLERASLALTREGAEQVGVSTSSKVAATQQVAVDLRGEVIPLRVGAVLGPEAIGAAAQALVAVMPLEELQRLGGFGHRVSRILVEAEHGSEDMVHRELLALAGGRVSVANMGQDLRELHQALAPGNEASALFASIAVLLGFLFAFNAMLLTAPQRRKAIADLRVGGTRRAAVAEIVLFQALCLGLAASILGALGGYVLLRTAFHEHPGYLTQAFILGGGEVVGVVPVILAFVGGVAAACLASALPLLDLRKGRALDAIYFEDGEDGNWVEGSLARRLALVAAVLAVTATALWLIAPALALPGVALLALASVLAVPWILGAVLASARWLVRRHPRFTALSVALRALQATTLRSLALVTTGAVALFGATALGGARSDLMHGLGSLVDAGAVGSDIEVLIPHDTEQTSPIREANYADVIARTPGVAHVDPVYAQFISLGSRRAAVFARPAISTREALRIEIVHGDLEQALRRLANGWITVSKDMADEFGASIGYTLTLPTPTGSKHLRVAAITTDVGWPGGAILTYANGYRALWPHAGPTAFAVSIAPGAELDSVRRLIELRLGPSSGLEVKRERVWAAGIKAEVGAGLSQLSSITAMFTVAAILALATALASMIWRRRTGLAALRLSGVRPPRLRQILALECLLLLGTSCTVGIAAGGYAQLAIDRYLQRSVGFPLSPFASGWHLLEVAATVVATVLALAAVPGYTASRVSPALALDKE